MKLKTYCIKCGKETIQKISKIIIDGEQLKLIGRCSICNSYVCRVKLKA